jgi:S-adenosylmethionine:tRNA ribosyltransferase-isomerase
VGTTVTRTLESLYWHGIKRLLKPGYQQLNIRQWDPYDLDPGNTTDVEALEKILDDMNKDGSKELLGSTSVLIAPGYRFRMVDVLVTNFHQPENTLILLVAAFVGEDWKEIYNYALNNEFRFLSYGDSSILFRNS